MGRCCQLLSRGQLNPADTSQARWPYKKFAGTKSLWSSSSESCHSRGWCGNLLKTLAKLTSGSRVGPLWPCKRPRRLIWWVSSRTPTFVPSMRRGSQSCQKTFNWHAASEGRGTNSPDGANTELGPFQDHHILQKVYTYESYSKISKKYKIDPKYK